MLIQQNRREFLKTTSKTAFGLGLLGFYNCNSNAKNQDKREEKKKELFFKISLAQWSLHRAFQNKELDNLDFAATAKNKFEIDAIEYVSQFFNDKAKDKNYLAEMKKRAMDYEVKSLLIMVDGEGALADPDDKNRKKAVENHIKWLEAAQYLGCHSIRVNAAGKGEAATISTAAIDGLGRLAELGADYDLNVIVENHGGYSSDGAWLSNVISQVNLPNCGTLPDFGNFCIKRDNGLDWGGNCIQNYDPYKGVSELMKYAKAVSAKSYDFNEKGKETTIDFMKMMQIVKNAGYQGYIGIEYEGNELSETEGILATKKLLQTVGQQLF